MVVLSAPQPCLQQYRSGFPAMGSQANDIVVAAPDAARARRAMQAAVDEVLRIERKYTRYRADSVVGRINAAAGTGVAIACDAETLELLRFADTLYHRSDGLFDISSGVLRRAWNFAQPRVPHAAELEPLLALVGWPRVERTGATVRLPERGMELDFGGFGKEYAADRAAAALTAHGIEHGYVNLAGDIHAIGPRPDGAPWLIGVQDPRRPGSVIATIPLERGALATSGDYERFFELDGHRYCHVLDPRTGYPVDCWASVSVLAPLAIVAGSHTTVAMLQRQRALDFLRGSGLRYLCVDTAGQVHSS